MNKVTFHLNQGFDRWVGYHFCDLQRGGHDFSEEIFSVLPKLNIKALGKKEKKQKIFAGVSIAYHEKKKGLIEAKKRIERLWRKAEKDAFDFYNCFFNLNPDFQIKAYISIFNVNPRGLEEKSFQVYYKSENPVRTCLHEIGHFYFYECLRIDRGLESYRTLEKDNTIWSISEIFNNFLLAQPKIKKLHNSIPPGYPAHHKITLSIAKRKIIYRDFHELFSMIEKEIKNSPAVNNIKRQG